VIVGRHDTERFFTSYELDFHVHFVYQITVLEEYVGVYATNHVDDVAGGRESGAFHQTAIPCRGVATRFVCVEELGC